MTQGWENRQEEHMHSCGMLSSIVLANFQLSHRGDGQSPGQVCWGEFHQHQEELVQELPHKVVHPDTMHDQS